MMDIQSQNFFQLRLALFNRLLFLYSGQLLYGFTLYSFHQYEPIFWRIFRGLMNHKGTRRN